jgi:hypothetical protein
LEKVVSALNITPVSDPHGDLRPDGASFFPHELQQPFFVAV